MKCSNPMDAVRFSRASDLDNLELLHATFVTHSFPRHTHETFAIGVIERGVQATYYKGATPYRHRRRYLSCEPRRDPYWVFAP